MVGAAHGSRFVAIVPFSNGECTELCLPAMQSRCAEQADPAALSGARDDGDAAPPLDARPGGDIVAPLARDSTRQTVPSSPANPSDKEARPLFRFGWGLANYADTSPIMVQAAAAIEFNCGMIGREAKYIGSP